MVLLRGSVSEMTYTVSSGTLNSSIPYTIKSVYFYDPFCQILSIVLHIREPVGNFFTSIFCTVAVG